MQFYVPLYLALFLELLYTVTAINFCSKSLCFPNEVHVACRNNRKFNNKTCPSDAGIVKMTLTLSDHIVRLHNEKRNLIAGGGDPRFEPACRMATMRWNPFIAGVAELNVKKCVIEHDKCINTFAFRKAGQNLSFKGYYQPLKPLEQIKAAVKAWYDEIELANMNQMREYKSENLHATGHFTAMMIDKNYAVGCAMSQYSVKDQPYRGFLFACNYAITNIIGQPIWEACRNATSKCKKGRNKNFKNLCAIAEPYKLPGSI